MPYGPDVQTWADPRQASVFDSPVMQAIRLLAGLAGANEPDRGVMQGVSPLAAAGWKGRKVSVDALNEIREQILGESGGKLAVMDLRPKADGLVELETMAVSPRSGGQGAGTRAMEALIRWADEAGLDLLLSPASKGYQPIAGGPKTTSTARLKEFYKRFGFVDPTSKRHYDPALSSPTRPTMYRRTKTADAIEAIVRLAEKD